MRTRLPVDNEKWCANRNPYDLPPDYYYDEIFVCSECGAEELWSAKQQKEWYEEKNQIYSFAKRCRKCRAHIKALKEEQKRHMEEMANKEPHPNEEFFKKKHT